jgi:hypothetical protein
VEGALRNALDAGQPAISEMKNAPTLLQQISGDGKKVKVVLDRKS